MKKQIIIPTVALFVICLVATALLALANNVTAPIIEKNSAESEAQSRMEVLEDAKSFEDKTCGKISYAVGLDENGQTVGMIFTTTSKSYGGDLVVMTGVDNEGKIAGIQILQISDTAGLGMKAQTDSFKDQFKGLVSGIKVAKKSADHDSNEILALTGATITSNAVTTAVNEALENFKTITENGGAN